MLKDARILFVNCAPYLGELDPALQAEECSAWVFSCASEALDWAAKNPADLLVAQAPLPDMDLLAFLTGMAVRLPAADALVIGQACEPDLLLALLNCGRVGGFLLAPESLQTILHRCAEMLRAGRARLEAVIHSRIHQNNQNLKREIQLRSNIQELLQTEKELLSTTLMSIGEGVIVTDEESRIILINRAAELITGFEALEAVDAPLGSIFQLCDSATQQPYPDLIWALFQLDEAESSGINYHAPTLQTRSGARLLISGKIAPRKSEFDKTVGYVIIFEDITDKQRFAAQTALSQKMEAIGQLAAGIAHEINTPIQYIGDNLRFLNKAFSRYAETLQAFQQTTGEHLDSAFTQADLDSLQEMVRSNKIARYQSEIPTAIEEALDGIERVRKIVLAMREFSHPTEREKKLADINHGIETTITISRNEWKYCADIETDFDPALPLVECQIDEINQVVLNMIVNASQAIQEKYPIGQGQKGKISISTRQSDEKVMITIGDNGAGIPEEIRDRIFDPFFTTKGVGRGTGQGLSVARNIISKKHQGAIYLDSQLNQGSRFTIELPVHVEQGE